MSDIYSNPDPSEREPGVGNFRAAVLGRGASGTWLWFLLIFGAILALALVANRCGDDGGNAGSDDVSAVAAATTEDGSAADVAPDPTATPTAEPEPTATPDPEPEPTPAPEPTAVPLTPSAATIAIGSNGSVTVSGTVADQAARDELVAAATSIAGDEANVIDELTIDADTTTNDGGAVTVLGSLEEATSDILQSQLGTLGSALAVDTSQLETIASTDVVAQLNELFALNPVQFATGSAEILADSQPVLDEVATILVTAPGLNLNVEGHTDNTGDPASNLSLSQGRAEAVRTYLVNAGVGEERLTAIGAGDASPIADNDTSEGRQQNRRIEFAVG